LTTVPVSTMYVLSNQGITDHEVSTVLKSLGSTAALVLIIQLIVLWFTKTESKELTRIVSDESGHSPTDVRIVRSAIHFDSDRRPTQTWRSREDFHQRILYRAVAEVTLYDGRQFRVRTAFFGLYGAPLLAPFLLLVLAPPIHSSAIFQSATHWDSEVMALFSLVAVNWAAWSVIYWYILSNWVLSPLLRTFYTRPLFGLSSPLPIRRETLAEVQRSFNRRGVWIVNLMFTVAAPLYITVLGALL